MLTTPTNGKNQKTVIYPSHLDKALQNTRPSIGEKERGRLQGVYDEFLGVGVGGRGGGTKVEVGGRVTLA